MFPNLSLVDTDEHLLLKVTCSPTRLILCFVFWGSGSSTAMLEVRMAGLLGLNLFNNDSGDNFNCLSSGQVWEFEG